MNIKVLMAVGRIPDGQTVTKKTGTKEYIVQRKLVVGQAQPMDIRASNGVVFLFPKFPGSTYIDAVSEDLEVAWSTSVDQLRHIFELY